MSVLVMAKAGDIAVHVADNMTGTIILQQGDDLIEICQDQLEAVIDALVVQKIGKTRAWAAFVNRACPSCGQDTSDGVKTYVDTDECRAEVCECGNVADVSD